MMSIVAIIIQLVAGAVGGNIAGIVRCFSLGPTGNSVAGGLGGVIIGQFIQFFLSHSGEVLLTGILGHIVGGVLAGAIVTSVIGLVRNLIAK